jgi:hypothetical protein
LNSEIVSDKYYLNSDQHDTGFFSNPQNPVVDNQIVTNLIFTRRLDHDAPNRPTKFEFKLIFSTVFAILHLHTVPDVAVGSSSKVLLAVENAIRQTFAELCAERKRLGTTCFSRLNHRDGPETDITTLVYQLPRNISQSLFSDPHKTPSVQFK